MDELERNLGIANTYFGSLLAGDEKAMRSVFREDATFWTNFRNADVLVSESIPRWCGLKESFEDLHFENVRRRGIPGGFLEQHVLCGTPKGGEPFRVIGCFVGTIEDGLITRLEEYVDSSQPPGR